MRRISLIAAIIIGAIAATVIMLGGVVPGPPAGRAPDYPFASDQCSVLSPVWRFTVGAPPDWEDCCVAHDRAYWPGGTRRQRSEADRALQYCVTAKGHPAWGIVLRASVRVGGHPLLPTRWRWGFGWKYPTGYRAADNR